MVEMSGNGCDSNSWNSTAAIGKLWGTSFGEVDGGDVGGHKGFGLSFRPLTIMEKFRPHHDVDRPFPGRNNRRSLISRPSPNLLPSPSSLSDLSVPFKRPLSGR